MFITLLLFVCCRDDDNHDDDAVVAAPNSSWEFFFFFWFVSPYFPAICISAVDDVSLDLVDFSFGFVLPPPLFCIQFLNRSQINAGLKMIFI